MGAYPLTAASSLDARALQPKQALVNSLGAGPGRAGYKLRLEYMALS
jgi:hypothetical protein